MSIIKNLLSLKVLVEIFEIIERERIVMLTQNDIDPVRGLWRSRLFVCLFVYKRRSSSFSSEDFMCWSRVRLCFRSADTDEAAGE